MIERQTREFSKIAQALISQSDSLLYSIKKQLNLLNLRYREIKKIVSQNKKVNKETLSQKLSSYHKLLYTYNLCHPLANNGGIFSDFEHGNLSYIVNSFYPENIVIKSDAEDPENDTVEVPYPEQVEAESDE